MCDLYGTNIRELVQRDVQLVELTRLDGGVVVSACHRIPWLGHAMLLCQFVSVPPVVFYHGSNWPHSVTSSLMALRSDNKFYRIGRIDRIDNTLTE